MTTLGSLVLKLGFVVRFYFERGFLFTGNFHDQCAALYKLTKTRIKVVPLIRSLYLK